MSVLARSASCCYPVSNKWLIATGSDVPDYVDINEIRQDADPGHPKSAYLTWVLANDAAVFKRLDGTNPSRSDHQAAANFIDNGIRIGAVADSPTEIGNDIKGVLKNNTIITKQEYAGYISHPERYQRIYRKGTNVENFWFLGYNES